MTHFIVLKLNHLNLLGSLPFDSSLLNNIASEAFETFKQYNDRREHVVLGTNLTSYGRVSLLPAQNQC